MTVRIGLVGYGVGGRLFHAPYIAASTRCALVGIVARSPERISAANTDHPGVPVFGSLTELAHAGVDAVTITTPTATRDALVREAVAHDIHVLADKPFAPSANDGRRLAELADEAGVILNVFHNRRFDSDIVTAREVIASGALGQITRLDLRCDQDDPTTLEAGPTGGLLRDLGSHVVDQALSLMGPPVFVSAQLDWADLPAGRTDTAFVITIGHEGGRHSHVSSSKTHRLSSRELRLLGERGSYSSDYRDVQIEAIRAGLRPAVRRAEWGYELEDRWGRLNTVDGERPIPSTQGDYTQLYDAFAAAIENGGPGPVPAHEGVTVLSVLDAARESAISSRTVLL